MKVYKKVDLSNIIDFYYKYYFRLRDLIKITKYLNAPATQEEYDLISQVPYFRYTANATWAIIVIDLCKILQASNQQRHNLPHLLLNIKEQPQNAWILTAVSEAEVDKWISRVESLGTTVESLKILRDKHYAHTDSLGESELYPPSFKDVDDCLFLIKEFVYMIGVKALENSYMFPNFHFVNPEEIVKATLKYLNE